MSSLVALSRLHNLASETTYLADHIGQNDADLLMGLTINHAKFKKAATKIRH